MTKSTPKTKQPKVKAAAAAPGPGSARSKKTTRRLPKSETVSLTRYIPLFWKAETDHAVFRRHALDNPGWDLTAQGGAALVSAGRAIQNAVHKEAKRVMGLRKKRQTFDLKAADVVLATLCSNKKELAAMRAFVDKVDAAYASPVGAAAAAASS